MTMQKKSHTYVYTKNLSVPIERLNKKNVFKIGDMKLKSSIVHF